ncbi:GntR family transcriptional regulator [Burkholderia metallica]|uniref:GntR family transcriptional regulator n=1 Tax=Burkholderia metallica TaxID=488729 RepID=UPI0020C6D57A|nr:GntR family transcriptional regulator [Burkholderia metallica]
MHRQLFVVIREQILRGRYAPGAILPKEEELCGQFSVSRITVRRALTDLEHAGLIKRRQGKGTFVSLDLPESRPPATLGLVDSLRKTADETEVEVLQVEALEPPVEIRHQLAIEDNERAVYAARVRKIGETRVMVTESWVPERFGRGVTAAKLQKRALYEILLSQGVKFGRVVQEITAVVADPRYAQLLAVDVGAPLLRLTRLLYDVDRQPVQHLTVHMSSEHSRILMDVSIDQMNTLSAGHIHHDV